MLLKLASSLQVKSSPHLGTLKVIAHKQALQELGDGVAVLVGFLLNDPDEVLHNIPPPLVDHHCCGQVAQQVLRCRLKRVQIPAGEYGLGVL